MKVEFLQYPFTLILEFWVHAVCCAQTLPDRGREQLTMANGDNAHASGAFAS